MDAHATSTDAVRIEVMRTSGACAGVFAGAPIRVHVHSVHRHAVNLLVDGVLFTIADGTLGGLPNGLEIRDFDALRDALRPGMRPDVFATLAAGATIWSARLEALGVPEDLGRRREALGAAMSTLPWMGLAPLLVEAHATDGQDDAQFGRSLAGAMVAAAGMSFDRLRDALVRGDERGAADAGTFLVGLGPGVTPSGDDLLVGLTAALTAAAHPLARPLAVAWAADAERGTNLVAATFHRHAAAGEYSERIHHLMAAILTGPIDGIDAAVRRAADWGATSGGDTLVGVVAAFSGIQG